MGIWFALFIPVLVIIALYIFFHTKIVWWESLGILVVVALVILLMKYCTEVSQTSDKEYYMDYTIQGVKYDAWDEEVSCRHPKYCQEYNSCKSKDSKGNCQGGYETVQCGYEHLYDVDYHPEHYEANTKLGDSYNISLETYFRLMKQFKATPVFVEMNRDFHSIDGDAHSVNWDGNVNSVEYLVSEHTYENRIQASHTVLNFPIVDTADVRYYKLKEYPDVRGSIAPSLLGEDNYPINRYINQSNALFAHNKQAKVFYLIFKNLPVESALKQEQYWKGGNKNEINICIGIDNQRQIKWAYVFSWTKKEIVKIEIRDNIMEHKVLNDVAFKSIIDNANNVIIKKFERRHFKEFSYLTVEPTKACVVWAYIISALLSIGLGLFAITNGMDADGSVNYDNGNNYNGFNNRYNNLRNRF
jgi:hypothetical protein